MNEASLNASEDQTERQPVGRVVSVTGSRAIIQLDCLQKQDNPALRPEMGTLLRINAAQSIVFGLVTALRIESYHRGAQTGETWVGELDMVGELLVNEAGELTRFRRGVTAYPNLGDKVYLASNEELRKTFENDDDSAIEVGRLTQDPSIPAFVKVDELLGKHFAILGTTGTGKSCTVALLLRSILWDNPLAHILLIDPHNEYSASFGQAAEVISPENLYLPYWFLTFQEIVEVFLGDRPESTAEQEILADIIPAAKARYAQGQSRNTRNGAKSMRARLNDGPAFTVDSPVPYRISDVLDLILDRMGRLEHKNSLGPYKLLKSRIEAVSKDPRFAFMFGSVTVNDDMASILSRLFRVPVNNRPITILELTGLPSEVVNVVVSVICRMTFDFALWSNGLVPVTIVCEEAHRYIPKDRNAGFEPTRRAISRIAKEGRKYGVSLGIVTQRPTELDPTIISQCNTVFAMRMSNELDQAMVRAAIPDAAESVLEFLPSLGTGEAIAFGDGVTVPARLKFNRLPEHALPHSTTAKFTEKWSKNITDPKFMEAVIKRWRAAGHSDVDYETETSRQPHGHGPHGGYGGYGGGSANGVSPAPGQALGQASGPLPEAMAGQPSQPPMAQPHTPPHQMPEQIAQAMGATYQPGGNPAAAGGQPAMDASAALSTPAQPGPMPQSGGFGGRHAASNPAGQAMTEAGSGPTTSPFQQKLNRRF